MSVKQYHLAQDQYAQKSIATESEYAPTQTTVSPMEWYRLTESSRNILNTVITTAAKKKLKERGKLSPDQQLITQLTSLYQEAQSVSQDSNRFESLESMREIVIHYGQVLKTIQQTY